MFLLTLIFATVHSGLASLRDIGEKLIGERAFRVLFAGTSLLLAVSTVVSSRSSSYEHKIKFYTANLWPFYPYLIELIDASRAVIQVQFTDHIYCNSGVFYQPQIRWCSVMAVTGCSCVTSIIMAL